MKRSSPDPGTTHFGLDCSGKESVNSDAMNRTDIPLTWAIAYSHTTAAGRLHFARTLRTYCAEERLLLVEQFSDAEQGIAGLDAALAYVREHRRVGRLIVPSPTQLTRHDPGVARDITGQLALCGVSLTTLQTEDDA